MTQPEIPDDIRNVVIKLIRDWERGADWTAMSADMEHVLLAERNLTIAECAGIADKTHARLTAAAIRDLLK